MSDQRLIILRHAKSDWSTDALTDFDRPLAKRGKRDAPRMGAWLAKNMLVPDVILSSPAKRAKQTAGLVADELGIKNKDIEFDDSIYCASLRELLHVLNNYRDSGNTLLLVGHNPGLDTLLCYLSSDEPETDINGKLMTTAAIAVLNFSKTLDITGQGKGKLEHLIRPKVLK